MPIQNCSVIGGKRNKPNPISIAAHTGVTTARCGNSDGQSTVATLVLGGSSQATDGAMIVEAALPLGRGPGMRCVGIYSRQSVCLVHLQRRLLCGVKCRDCGCGLGDLQQRHRSVASVKHAELLRGRPEGA